MWVKYRRNILSLKTMQVPIYVFPLHHLSSKHDYVIVFSIYLYQLDNIEIIHLYLIKLENRKDSLLDYRGKHIIGEIF